MSFISVSRAELSTKTGSTGNLLAELHQLHKIHHSSSCLAPSLFSAQSREAPFLPVSLKSHLKEVKIISARFLMKSASGIKWDFVKTSGYRSPLFLEDSWMKEDWPGNSLEQPDHTGWRFSPVWRKSGGLKTDRYWMWFCTRTYLSWVCWRTKSAEVLYLWHWTGFFQNLKGPS